MKTSVSMIACAALGLLALPQMADAQTYSRTWVSGTGDDSYPCSRTAPCKTFAGAITKTDPGGEIDVLDPGGFGTVTITKAVTIDGGGGQGGQVASILASGTVGVTVNAGANDKVTLRNLDINGAGTTIGTNGINFVAGAQVAIENTSIYGFSQACVNFQPNVHGSLVITNSNLESCGTSGVNATTTSGTNHVNIHQTTIHHAGLGVSAGANTDATITDSFVNNNPNGGVEANASTAKVEVSDSSVANNQMFGVHTSNGGTLGISGDSITLNNGTGVYTDTGQIVSGGNNWIHGNTTDGAPSTTPGPK